MSFDLPSLQAAVAAKGRVVRVLVARSAGSAPRGAGTSMLVWAGGQSGTIGGGRLEFDAAADALKMIDGSAESSVQTLPLGPALGQCCGGSVTLVWERFDVSNLPDALPFLRRVGTGAADAASTIDAKIAHLPEVFDPIMQDGWLVESALAVQKSLWIWGAGHVGRAIMDVLAPLPDFSITWVDTGPERFPETVPASVGALPAHDPVLLAAHAPTNADHIILTYSHELDLALCNALLARGFGTCGLIGSATKWARFRSRLTALGHANKDIARIACPIGDPSLGKHPQAIALGVATSLLKQADQTHNRGTARGDQRTA